MAKNQVRIGVGVNDQASRPIKSIRDAFERLQNQGAKGIGIGIGAAATLKTFDLVQSAALGLASAIGESVQKAVVFQRELANIKTIDVALDLDRTSKALQRMSGELGQSTSTLAKALYDISSSGFQGAAGLDVLAAAGKAAVAGLTTTAEAAKGISAVLNAYGLSADKAERVSDVMFQTVNRGVATFEEFSAEVGKLAAVASPLGVSFEEVAAAFAVLTRHGIATADAATQINAIMISMLKPSKQAADYAKELGIEWSTDTLRSKGLAGALQEMIKVTGGNNAKMAVLLGNSRAIRGAFALAGAEGKELNDELKIMQAAAGATARAFATMAETISFKQEQAAARAEAAWLRLGTALLPVQTKILDAQSDILTSLGAMADGISGQVTPEFLALQVVLGNVTIEQLKAAEAARTHADAVKRDNEGASHLRVTMTDLAVATGGVGDAADDAETATADLRSEFEKAEDAARDLTSALDELSGRLFGQAQLQGDIAKAAQDLAALKKEGPDSKSAADLAIYAGEIATLEQRLFELNGELAKAQGPQAYYEWLLKQTAAIQDADAATQALVLRVRALALLSSTVAPITFVRDYVDRVGGSVPRRKPKARVHGGPVDAGEPYWVGESGRPELMIPDTNGTIVPENKIGSMSGTTIINLTVQGDLRARTKEDVVSALQRAAAFVR